MKSLISLITKKSCFDIQCHCVLSEENVLGGNGFYLFIFSGYVMCSVYIFGGLIFCHNEYLFMSSSKSRAAFCSKNNQTDDLIWYSLGSIQYMQLDSLAWSVTNKHIHDIFLKWHVSAILIFWSYYAVSTLTIILKTFYAISRQLIIYRDKSSLLLQSSSRRLPGVFLWLLDDWWLQDLLESAAEATRPPCSAGVGMLAGWACPTRRSSRVDWSAARLPAWCGLVRRVSRDGKQSSLHSNTAPRSVQSVWRRRLLENKIFFNIQSSFTQSEWSLLLAAKHITSRNLSPLQVTCRILQVTKWGFYSCDNVENNSMIKMIFFLNQRN